MSLSLRRPNALASVLVAPMGSSLDALNALNAPSSLIQRRQAASNLPNFELPPPSNLAQFAPMSQHKYPPLTAPLLPTTATVSVGNLLTPPSNSASDSSASSAVNASGTTPNSGVAPVLPYAPFFSNNTSTFHTGLTPQPWQNGNGLFPPRSMFSPSSGLVRQSTNSPSTTEASNLPPPPYDLTNISYGNGFPMPSPTGASLASQQMLSNSMGRPHSQQSQGGPTDSMVSKPASAPSLFTNMAPSSHHSSGYPYSGSTPVSASPHSAHPSGPRQSPAMSQSQMPPQSQSPFIRPPYPSYSLPAMPGPAMSNVNSPGGHMSMVGSVGGMLPVGFNSGYSANPHNMYGQQRTQSPASNPQNDRPFRCDSCPQSFHRNHDLKRHKRIHLSVKPFPCKHCDKSFSRKDALKVRPRANQNTEFIAN